MFKLNRKIVITVLSYVFVAAIAFSITFVILKIDPVNPDDLVEHGPIIIVSDKDFEIYGFPGKGTIEEPYLIQNYNIDTNYSESIYISGTSKYFIIQNCYLKADFKSLSIENVANNTARVLDNTIISDEDFGLSISIVGSNDITLENNKVTDRWTSWTSTWPPWDLRTVEIRDCESPTIKNNIFGSQNLWIKDSENSVLRNNIFSGSTYSKHTILTLDSPNMIFIDNTFREDSAFVRLYSHSNTFSGNKAEDIGYFGIYSVNSTITNNQVNFGGYSYDYDSTSHSAFLSNTIRNNTVHTKQFGIFVDSENLEISTSIYGQLYFSNCINMTISDFQIESFTPGIVVRDSQNIVLERTQCLFWGQQALLFYNSTEFQVIECDVYSQGVYPQIDIIMSSNSSIEEGTFIANNQGIRIRSSTNISISKNNYINGQQGISVEDSADIVIKDNTFENIKKSIIVDGSNNILVGQNTLIEGEEGGIDVRFSSNCTIEYNELTNNDRGIYFYVVEYSLIQNNTFSNINEYGLWVQYSINCTFRYNQFENNILYGAYFEHSNNNTLYHNAFIDNYLPIYSQAYDDTGTNYWYNAGLVEGNYYSGWNSTLGAYSIDGLGSAVDPYPLDTNPLS